MSKYTDKFLDPRWQRKRLEIYNRDDFTCRKCHKKTNTLNVHHLYYLPNTDPWDYPDSAFLTLCKKCHEKERIEIPKKLKELIQAVKMLGITSDNIDPIINAFKNMPRVEEDWLQAFIIENLLTDKRAFNRKRKEELLFCNLF